MTKQEHKLKSMLNYFEVDLGGKKDEKMTKKEKQRFLDTFNQILDFYMLQEIMRKIKEKRQEEMSDDEEQDDFMLPPKELPKYDYDDSFEDEMMKNPENFFGNKKDKKDKEQNFNDPIDTDINKFLKWLTMILYTGDHSVIITEDKNGINIKLVKINKGKK
jgi:hypothetical protein